MKTLREFCESDLVEFMDRTLADVGRFNSVEEAAQCLAQGMFAECGDGARSDLALSRVFHSFEFGALPLDVQGLVRRDFGENVPDDKLFLCLLGTYGQEPPWQHRRNSQGHQAIPLSRESIRSIPMMTRLFQQIGFDLGILLKEDERPMNMSGLCGSYGLFYVNRAAGSPYVPAQEFVVKYGVESVFGTGVMLPSGDASIYIGFSRVALDEHVLGRLSPLMSLFWQKVFPLVAKGYFV